MHGENATDLRFLRALLIHVLSYPFIPLGRLLPPELPSASSCRK